MMAPSPPPVAAPAITERLSCSLAASKKYQVPANVVLAVATVENGKAGQWVPNANGSFDLGPMQLNTSYIASLARYGIRTEHVLASGCYPYMLAAWRLHGHLAHDSGDPWSRVANYNSRTPFFNLRYQARLAPAADAWRRWLEAYYPQMAHVGGTELASPIIPAGLIEPAHAFVASDHGRHHAEPHQAIEPVRECGVACAPMRVDMVFKAATSSSAVTSPSG